MEIITKNNLYNYSRESRSFSLNESINEVRNKSKISTDVTIFLSHKHSEKKELESVIQLLKSLRVNIYVDWMDEGMPKTTSGITATRIKQKIRSSNKFILLATEDAISSKWCNWELGIGDVHKFKDDIAIFPIKNNYSNYSGSEYLEIYPSIELENGIYYVVNPDRTKNRLISWLIDLHK